MQTFEECFDAYGADYKTTLDRFMGNEKMYKKFLNMLFQDNNLQKMGDALNTGDLKTAFEAAHTLKGVSANLGLTPLYNAVCEMVEPLRAGVSDAGYSHMYEKVCSEFDRAKELLAQLQSL